MRRAATTVFCLASATSLLLACNPDPPAIDRIKVDDPVKPAPSGEPVAQVHTEEPPAAQNSSLIGPSAPTVGANQLPPGHPPIAGNQPVGRVGTTQAPMDTKAIAGKVVETIPTEKYLYLQLEKDGKTTWAAVLKAPVKVGDEVTITQAALMTNFKSPTLDRTFETIWFGSLAGGHKTADSPAESAVVADKVEKAIGDTAKTVAEVISGAAALDGQTVTVRGKVVKFNEGILGRNWIHIQDGTGDAGANTHDLLVTTDATATVGDEVVVEGQVALNQDFGSGYSYAVLVEKGKVSAP